MKAMYLAYFDESGDSGINNSPTEWFVLNAILIHETVWLDTLARILFAAVTVSGRPQLLEPIQKRHCVV